MKRQKEEMNQIQQLAQKSEELEQQLKETTNQLKQATQKIESLNEAKLQLEQQKMQMEYKIEQFKAQTDRTYKEASAEQDRRRTDIEIQQLYDGNPYNDPIKNIK